MKIKIFVSSIYITYKKDNQEIEVSVLYGPLYANFNTVISKEILANSFTKKKLIDYLIVEKYSKVYHDIVNIYYEKYKIEELKE
jgi:hypothetical protein